MNALAKGWCPGALRPMESGDGLIVRLKITGGIAPIELAGAIARWSARCGNGQIDLTGRANLQLRGVTGESLRGLQEAIAAAGLLDANPNGEAVRNVVASPLAGLDPDAALDIRPIVASLEARLANDKRLHALPPKFCFAVDDGGRLGLGDVRADIRFEAVATTDGPIFEIILDEDRRLGSCGIDAVADTAAGLGWSFLEHRARLGADIRRIRDLTAACGLQSLVSAGKEPDPDPIRGWRPRVRPRAGPRAGSAPGEKIFSAADFLGIGLPFGRISAEALAELAHKARGHGATELRLTPWRAILVPLPSADAARSLAAALPAGIFILDANDPRRRVAACVGAPACPRATTDVRGDAMQLAASVPKSVMLHVSGCAKGCAHPRAAAVTLVGREGLYDLIRDGAPWDSPERTGIGAAEALGHARRVIEGAPA